MKHFRSDDDNNPGDSLIDTLAEQFGRLSPADQRQFSEPRDNSLPSVSIPRKYQPLWNLFKTLFDEDEGTQLCGKFKFLNLMERYTEPHRGYHTVRHLEDLASHYKYHQDLLGNDSKAVLATLFYHDAIYECRPGQDERESAELADIDLDQLGISKKTIRRATEIILATASHRAKPDDQAMQLFLDMDMSVLASKPDVYDTYLKNTCFEYCQKLGITPEVFHPARVERFLKPVLASDTPIFATEQFKPMEQRARQNMQRELETYQVKPLAPSASDYTP